MYKFLIISFLISGFSLFSQNPVKDYLPGKVVVKLKNAVPAPVNEQINSDYDYNSFGINALDATLQELEIKDIQQKFPHHSAPAFQSKMENDFGTDFNGLSNIYEIRFDENLPPKFVAKKIMQNKNVEYAEPVYVNEAYAEPDDARYSEQQFLPQILASDAWDIAKGQDGSEILIGICDSGTEWHHPDLIDNFWQNLGEDADGDGTVIQFNEETQKWEFDPDDLNGIDDDGNGYVDDLSGWNFVGMWDNTSDYNIDGSAVNSHGTHVAGLAAAVTDNETGVASISWNIKFMGTKHSPNDNGRVVIYGYEGIVYLAENGADIINMSWGGGSFSYYAQDVIEYARSLGAILVAAAGNNNNDEFHYPSAYAGIVSVASVASDDVKAYYSTYGNTVDIASPGGDRYKDGGVLATIPGHSYAKYQGTSMASPVAAGLFALVQSHFPDKTDEEIIQQIVGTTDDISAENPSFDNLLGSGRINAYKALTEEPQYPLGLELSVLSDEFHIYDEDFDFYYNTDVLFGGSEGILYILVKNNNNFYGQENVVFNIASDSEEITLMESTLTVSLGPDAITMLEIPFYVSMEVETGFHSITVTVEDPEEEILNGETSDFEIFVNNSDILAWQPLLGGEDMSAEFFAEYYEAMGFDVYLSDELLPSFEGFDAVFLSYGSTSAPDYNSYIMKLYQMLEPLEEYAYIYGENAKIYFESQNFFTHYNSFILDIASYYPLFGISDADYNEDESAILDNIYGTPNTMFENMNFSSSQNNTYELNHFTPAPVDMGVIAEPLFEIEDFGTVILAANNPLGNSVITSSVSLSQLDDDECPNTKRNLMRFIDSELELFAPIDIILSDEIVTCQESPVQIGADDISCGEYYPITNAITGGSGFFEIEWTPQYGLDDPYSANPTVLEPVVDRVYQMVATDVILGEQITHDVQLTVNNGAKVKLPLFKMVSLGSAINLNDQIITITGGTEPYLDYIWRKNNQIIGDSENEIPSIGINRYYLQVLDSDGCFSKTARMIVFVSMYKQFTENDVTVGENGTIVATAYPNPANNNINLLTVFENTTNATVSILDLNGNKLWSANKNSISEINESIDIKNLAAGTYFIKIDSDNDSVMKKFIKQ